MRQSHTEYIAMGRFRFGLFEFEISTKELRREGRLIRLQPQPAEMLVCLVEHAGQVVSREELRKAVWGNDTFVDFGRGLNFCIAQIRAALDDNADEPRYIRTIPKRGYQFIAPVKEISALDPNLQAHGVSTSTKSGTTKMIAVGFAACVLLVAVFAAGYWFRTRPAAADLPIVAVMRFDNETGSPEMSRFSDALSDMLVTELTTQGDGHYRVIGNANILRLPRDQRNLNAVGSALGASYVVLGQVQRNGDQTRILAHLIHLPDQTHVWVTRLDRTLDDPLALEAQVAQTVAAEFSGRIHFRPEIRPASHPRASL